MSSASNRGTAGGGASAALYLQQHVKQLPAPPWLFVGQRLDDHHI